MANNDHDKKIMNLMLNSSVIMMSAMTSGLTKAMIIVSSAMASGMAGALGGKEAGDKAGKKTMEEMPKADEKVRTAVSGMRKSLAAQLESKSKQIKPILSNPAFDAGPKIVERYDFELPKLTEELDDETLAKYARC